MNIPPFGWRARNGYEPPNNWRPWTDPYTYYFPAQRRHGFRDHHKLGGGPPLPPPDFDGAAGMPPPPPAPGDHFDFDDVYFSARHRRMTHHRRRRPRFFGDHDLYDGAYVPPPCSCPPPADDDDHAVDLSSTSCGVGGNYYDGKETETELEEEEGKEAEPEEPRPRPKPKSAKSTKSTAKSTITRTTISISSKLKGKKANKEKEPVPKAEAPKKAKKPEPEAAPKAEEEEENADEQQEQEQADDMSATSSDADATSDTSSVAGAAAPSVARLAVPGHKIPGGLRAGTHILHGQAHTKLHVFRKTGLKPWEPRKGSKCGKCVGVPKGPDGHFSIVGADVEWTVEKLMKALGRGSERWAVTEVVELGGNCWQKGSTVVFGSEMASRTLANMGWSERRGDGIAPPVWLVVHKA